MIVQATVGESVVDLAIHSSGRFPQVVVDGESADVDVVQLSTHSWSIIINGQSHHLSIEPRGEGYKVVFRQKNYNVTLRSEADQAVMRLGFSRDTAEASGEVTAPIPGLIASIAVSVGDRVTVGEPLLVLEAMKMENDLHAPTSGTIRSIEVSMGDVVEKGASLLSIDETPGG